MNATLNETKNSSYFDRTKHADWTIPMAINIILTFVVFWILLSLIHYGLRTGKWRKVKNSNSEKLNSGIVYSFLILNAVVCLAYLILSLFILNIKYVGGQDEFCDQLFDAACFAYGFVLITTGIFLWLRQRIFYSNLMLNVKYTKLVKSLSFISIITIVGFGMGVLISNTLPDNNRSSLKGCIYQPDIRFILAYALPGILVIGFGHVTLLSLFIHALMYSSKSKIFNLCFCISRNKNWPENSVEFSKQTQKSKKLIKITLWKSLTFAGISIVVDGAIQGIVFIIQPRMRIANALFNISAFLNLLFLILSFVQYKEMLFSFFYNRKMNDHIPVRTISG